MFLQKIQRSSIIWTQTHDFMIVNKLKITKSKKAKLYIETLCTLKKEPVCKTYCFQMQPFISINNQNAEVNELMINKTINYKSSYKIKN